MHLHPKVLHPNILHPLITYILDEFGDQKMGADLLLVIRDHIGDRSSVSVFNGLYYKKTAMVISQDFIFDRYIYAHELGHILGCGHEEGATPALKPSMFFAYSHIMVNGQCDLMSSPINRKCIQVCTLKKIAPFRFAPLRFAPLRFACTLKVCLHP